MTLEERKEKALELRRKGYNCAQSVLMAFPDITGLDDASAAKICNALGSGVAATGEICGVPNAMAITIGMTLTDAPEDKVKAMKITKPLIEEFAASNQNRIRCADLKGKEGIRPCNDLILQGIEILHNHFAK